MRPNLLFRKIHKWLGLILAIQILFWFTSGFLMSFMPIDEVRGDHLLQTKTTPPAIELNSIDLNRITAQVSEPVHSAEIKTWLNQTVVTVKTQHNLYLFNALTTERITIDQQVVKNILQSQLIPGYTIAGMQLLESLPNEVRGRDAPIWQVQLSGPENARIYISAHSGNIVAKRTDRWRLFDFMWMLHIMDYDERSDFNHPLLYLTALSALLFTLTGFVLLFFAMRRKK